MSGIRNYDVTFRFNYEFTAAATWLACGAISTLAPMYLDAPKEPYLGLVAVSVAMACRRIPTGWALLKTKKRLSGADLTFIALDKLKPILERYQKEKNLWLGYGWQWENKHTQLAYELSGMSIADAVMKDQSPSKKGWGWIHGLEEKEEEISQPLSHTAGHTLVVGTTGAGKTRMFDHLITQAIMRKDGAVFIIDPKGDKELCENARLACIQSGGEKRFHYFHPAFPSESCRLDPLRNFNRATELASRIAVLMASEQGNPFQAFGQMSLNNVCQGILTAGERPNLVKVRRYLEGGIERLVIKAISGYCDRHFPEWEVQAAPYTAKASNDERKAHALIKFYREKVAKQSSDLEGLFSMFEHDREHFQKMIASLLPIMSMLTSGELGALLSPEADDLDDKRKIEDSASIIRKSDVIYIGLDSLSDSMVGAAIGSIILSDLTSVAGDRYNFGNNENSVYLFVDETSEVMNVPLIQTLNKGRGAGYVATLATQTFADFAATLGDTSKAVQVLGNINNIISLRINDGETQEYFCKSLPKTRVKYVMQTQGTNSSSKSGESHSGNIGERLMEEEVEMLSPAMLGKLPDLEYFARLVDGRLLKGRIPLLIK